MAETEEAAAGWMDLLLEEPYRVDLRRRQPKGYDDHALHVLVVSKCHEDGEHPADFVAEHDGIRETDCWDPEWEVLHPPTCYRPEDLNGCCPRCSGPDYRCGLDGDLEREGEYVFDLVRERPLSWPEEGQAGIADLLPAGRYLIRWYVEPRRGGTYWGGPDDDLTGVVIVPGPVWDGDRKGWT